MIYLIGDIKRDVRVCLDQNEVSSALLADGDEETLMLDAVIESKILEAVERVHSAAPYHLLEQGHNFGYNPDSNEQEEVAVYWGDQESGWVLLPDDFMRLVVFEMSDWERAVYSLVTPADPEYAKCRSRVKAIRGTAQRPVCALGIRPEGRVLEFYSCKSEEATVRKAVYIPYPHIDDGGGIDISERCYQAVVYTIAGLTLKTSGDKEQSEVLLEMANTLMNK